MGQPVMQWQILARDPERCARFYGELFGWRIDAANALAYRAVRTDAGRGVDGGIWPTPPEGEARVQLFVEVEDVEACLARAIGLGAQVVVPRQVLPDGDEMAIIVDAEGLSTGLFKPAA
jgi:predicted enzyme related to lactoylglutathione lyase